MNASASNAQLGFSNAPFGTAVRGTRLRRSIGSTTKSAPRVRRIIPRAMRVRRGLPPEPKIPRTLFDAEKILDIDMQPFDFSALKGKVVLALNVASQDRRTDEKYTVLQTLLENYGDAGLEVLAYPSNWYGQKETWPHEKIKKMVHSKFTSRIKLLSKSDLEWNQVFALGTQYFPGEIIWNFHGKFLFNRNGVPVGRYDLLSTYETLEEAVQKQIAGGRDVMPSPEFEKKEDEFDITDLMHENMVS